jgi:ankyrin repeat protein
MYFLITHGAELEAKDMAGRTPLFLAVKNGNHNNLDIIKVKKKKLYCL